MCGITGVLSFNEIGRISIIHLSRATDALSKRGPDSGDTYLDYYVGLGHRRLAIIDTSEQANQPMTDESKRYVIVFNGEIFNFKEIKQKLIEKGISFTSQSDTEVLLKSYIYQGAKCLDELNGFFAFAIYDKEEQSLFIARDRMGIKPLLYCQDEDRFIFGSEMKAILTYGIDKQLDYASLQQYLQLNYIPAPHTIFQHVKKLLPGHYLKVTRKEVEIVNYYKISTAKPLAYTEKNYLSWQKQLVEHLEASVQRRLIADVSLGAFLSGGIDSSIIVALASQHTTNLNTFSIGYKDQPFFDETKYAQVVAKKFKTNHTVFALTQQDLFGHLSQVLEDIDEPFADSSALAVHILSQYTKKHVKVALSGDGADELWAGYNKHLAEYKIRKGEGLVNFAKTLLPIWKILPKSRNGFVSNKVRQLQRLAEGAKLNTRERYWRWASISSESQAKGLLSDEIKSTLQQEIYDTRKKSILENISLNEAVANMQDVLYTDMHLVLPNDMLTKVDLMSMANGLEVRVPFLDYEVVNFAFSLPIEAKVNAKMRKRILQDAFKDILPTELYNRPKQGFEIPLLDGLRTELKSSIHKLLAPDFLAEQKIFNPQEVQKIVDKLFSNNPEDSHAQIWALLVFQNWWKKYLG